MRILVAGDLHYDKRRVNELNNIIPQCDCVCLTGDYLDDSLRNIDEQIKWVSDWIKSIRKPIFMCSWNHDLDQLADCEWLYTLKSSTVKIDNQIYRYRGIIFGVVPYLGAEFSTFSLCDVLVTHLPPKNTKTARQDGNDFGDDALYNALKMGNINPKLIFCGHVEHPDANQSKLFDTNIYNPGRPVEGKSTGYQLLSIDSLALQE